MDRQIDRYLKASRLFWFIYLEETELAKLNYLSSAITSCHTTYIIKMSVFIPYPVDF